MESLARHALSSRQEKYLEQARRLLVGDLPTAAGSQASSGGAAAAAAAATAAGAAGSADAHPQHPQHQEASAGGAAAGGASWETVTAGAPLVVDQEYYSRLAAGELQVGPGGGA